MWHLALTRAWEALVLLAALTVTGAPCGAQPPRATGSIVGIVSDSASGLPIVAAEVRLTDHHIDRTHEDGRFEFTGLPTGRYEVTVRRLGYRQARQSVDVPENSVAQVKILMRAAAVELSPTVVTGSLSARPGEELLSPTSVLSGSILDRKLDATIATSLLSQPGVSVTSISPVTARPVIRGLGGDRILVLEDGQRPGDLSAMSARPRRDHRSAHGATDRSRAGARCRCSTEALRWAES